MDSTETHPRLRNTEERSFPSVRLVHPGVRDTVRKGDEQCSAITCGKLNLSCGEEAFIKWSQSLCGGSQNGAAEEVVAIRAMNEVAFRSFVGGGMHGWAVRCVMVLHKGLRMQAGGGEEDAKSLSCRAAIPARSL